MLERLSGILGAQGPIASAYGRALYRRDAGFLHAEPLAVCLPENVEQLAAVVRLCSEYQIGFTPRGAGTGLAGGAVPLGGTVVIGLGRMNRILEIDTDNRCAWVEPGVENARGSGGARTRAGRIRQSWLYPPPAGRGRERGAHRGSHRERAAHRSSNCRSRRRDGAEESMSLPLDGVRVLDLTQVMAGPFCTLMLADLGADVIKIETPGTGDLTRRMGGARMRMKGEDNAPFFALNRNKRSVVLDLKNVADRESFYQLVRAADMVVESFRPRVTKKLGIDYETLVAIRPDLIYGSVSGFGQTGPYADRPGFDLIAQAMAGVMSVTGEPGGKPVKCGIPISDLGAGLYCALALLAAYIHRMRTGQGQYVETSLFDAAVALSVWETAELWATGDVPQPFGSAHRLSAPYQALKTRDGYLVVAAITERQWQQLCDVLGRRELAADPRFATNAARMAHLAALAQELEAVLAGRDTDEWVERLLAADVPAGPIHNYREVFDDSHTHARSLVLEIDHPVEGRVRTLGFPVKLSGTPVRERRPPPRLGEHNQEVLRAIEHDRTPASPSPAGEATSAERRSS